jgi:iron complex transport system substrate-binding protein
MKSPTHILYILGIVLAIALIAIIIIGPSQPSPREHAPPSTLTQTHVVNASPSTHAPPSTPAQTHGVGKVQYPVEIVDADGRRIVLEKPAERIVTHAYATWVLVALNASDKVVATSRTVLQDPALKKKIPNASGEVPFFSPAATINIEAIVSLNPDVIIAPTTNYYPESVLEAKLPPTIKVVRLNLMNVDRLVDDIRLIGIIVNKTKEAELIAQKTEKLLNLVKERVAKATTRPRVYIEWFSSYSTLLRGSPIHPVIELLGGHNIFSDLEAKGWPTAQVSPESVIQRAPDIILKFTNLYNPCIAKNLTTLEKIYDEIRRRPGWSSIPAVANNRTYIISIFYDGGYGKAVQVALLAKLLYPELFADIDVDELFNDLLRTMGIDRYCTGTRVWVYPPLDHKPPPLRTAPSYPATIIDAWNRTVILEKPAKRVVTHNNYAAWVLAALNATELIVGVGDNLDPLTQKVIGRDVPSVGPWNAPSVEKILALNPDVVIVHDVSAVETILRKIPPNIKVVVLSLVGDPENVMKEVRIIGLIINKTDAAERLVSKYEKLLEQIKSMLQRTPREKVRVYFEFWYPNLNALGGGHPTFNKIIEMAGGVNIFGHVPQRTISVSPETVIALDPDVVIGRVSFVTTRYNPCLNDTTSLAQFYKMIIESRPGWDQMRAVKQGRMYMLSNEYLQALGTVAMVGYLAKAFYPETFRDFDPNLIMTEWLRDMGIEKYCRGARVWLYPS